MMRNGNIKVYTFGMNNMNANDLNMWMNNYNNMMNNFNMWMNNLNSNNNSNINNQNNSHGNNRNNIHFHFNDMMDELNSLNFQGSDGNINININVDRSNFSNNEGIRDSGNTEGIRNSGNNESIRNSRISLSNSINSSVNLNNLSGMEKKKLQLILEMDEYQYKHIQKYDSRKETECAICLEEFKGVDIIKAFSTCQHIFHKKCLLNWLKTHNKCPLCNHDLSDDMRELE